VSFSSGSSSFGQAKEDEQYSHGPRLMTTFHTYLCTICHQTQIRFSVNCTNCHAANSLVELKPPKQGEESPKIIPMSEVEIIDRERYDTPINENLNGGITHNSMTIIAGVPGGGKSTITLKTLCHIAAMPEPPLLLYITSEEGPEMIKLRSQLINVSPSIGGVIHLLAETELERIIRAIKEFLRQPSSMSNDQSAMSYFVVLDSINAVLSRNSTSAPGSPSNIVKTLNALHSLRTKYHELTIFIVGHANKQGKIAGPLTLQHMVDTVLLLEVDKSNSRILTTLKNRFGPSGIRSTFELQSLVHAG
jgi:DNA repair protein RadA/Sms